MKPRRLVSMLCAVGACLLLAVPMFAAGGPVQKDIVRVIIDPSVITVDPETELDNGRIRLINPEGLEIIRDFRGGQGQISIGELADEVEGLSLDGCWTYEVIGTAPLSKSEIAALKEARESGRPAPLALQQKLSSLNQSGSFMVEEGRFMYDPETGETDDDGRKLRAEGLEGDAFRTAVEPGAMPFDILHNDDVIIFRSLCVGFDCVNGEVFNADTIRLKENNLRIHFEDTSTAAGFPTTDWRIVANDQASGGASKFTVQDASANRNVFTVEANAPSNSLYVDDGGRVGMGTSTPVTEIHAVDGDTPTLRLAQDGSSGFAPQTWDIAGNETSFFVRDATNGSTLPFRIRPGAASNSLVIDADNDVGVGTLSPSEALHLRGTDGATTFLVEEASGTEGNRVLLDLTNNGQVRYVLRDTSADGEDWEVSNLNTGFAISLIGSGGAEVLINERDPSGASNVMTVDGDVAAVDFNMTSSRDLKTGLQALNPQQVLSRLMDLDLFEWSFTSDPAGVRHLGPMAEDFHDIFRLSPDNKHISLVDSNGVALAAIQGLHEVVSEKDQEIAELREALKELQTVVDALVQE